MISKSIRWRLLLSYAAIALLAALSLGVVLLTTLRGYYLQRELDYLASNAQAMSSRIALLVQADLPPAALQSQLESFSFLSQTRVRLLDEAGQVLADSGSPQQRREVVAMSVEVEVETDRLTQAFAQTVIGNDEEKRYVSVIVIEDTGLENPEGKIRLAETVVITGSEPGRFERIIRAKEGQARQPGLISLLPAVGTPYGFGLSAETASRGRRSDQTVTQPFYNIEDSLTGYVELSSGPAYGREVLTSVARGWAVAGGLAVLLAVGVGWLISLRLSTPLLALTGVTASMAGGDLSARADTTRQDEFGLLARSFNEMADRVEETIVALRRFVADAAHELHTPLTALHTNLELAANEEDEAKQLAFVERAQTQVERLEMLISGLLDLSRLEAGAGQKERVLINVTALVQEASELYASRAEQAGLSFSLVLPEGTVTPRGNEAQLRRALGNLLDNAIKFTPEGGRVSVGLQQKEGWVELGVEDTGIGIPADDLPHLFSRFHRGRKAVAYPGSGLGLAIVKAIVEGHGGQVQAENTAHGARFLLRLPTDG